MRAFITFPEITTALALAGNIDFYPWILKPKGNYGIFLLLN
jgi:hypothetical protein